MTEEKDQVQELLLELETGAAAADDADLCRSLEKAHREIARVRRELDALIKQAAKRTAERAILRAKMRIRELEMDRLNEIRMAELRKQEWIERLERERGLRGRVQRSRLEPREEADDADRDS